jgi:hypothetical protein
VYSAVRIRVRKAAAPARRPLRVPDAYATPAAVGRPAFVVGAVAFPALPRAGEDTTRLTSAGAWPWLPVVPLAAAAVVVARDDAHPPTVRPAVPPVVSPPAPPVAVPHAMAAVVLPEPAPAALVALALVAGGFGAAMRPRRRT